MDLLHFLFLGGWILEIIGIILLVTTSIRLSDWIFKNWMRSTNPDFENDKNILKKRLNIQTVLGIVLIVAGLTFQLPSMFN